jgi:hypothetical protein
VLLLAVGTLLATLAGLLSTSSSAAGGAVPPAHASSDGTVSGTVTITGAPKGFVPAYLGVGACAGGAFVTCRSPQYAVSGNATFSFKLKAGTWDFQSFYALSPDGGAFLGGTASVEVTADSTTTKDFTVPYKTPGSVKGTVSVTGVPSGVTVEDKSVIACPSYAPNPNAAGAILLCAQSAGSGSYSLTTLAPGTWILYVTYQTEFGETTASKGTTVDVVSGATQKVDVTTTYQLPASGVVSGAAVVTSAPAGFNGLEAVIACKGSKVSLSCSSLAGTDTTGTTYSLTLPDGKWTLAMIYELQPYGGLEIGPSHSVTVSSGQKIKLAVAVAYKAPGTIRGQVAVSDVPSGVSVQTYSVLACPAGSPYNGDSANPGCAAESSGLGTGIALAHGAIASASATRHAGAFERLDAGSTLKDRSANAGDQYSMPLPPGKWLLYPGYSTVYGTAISKTGTPVTVTSNKSVTTDLTLAYQPSDDGLVTGTVTLLDEPATLGVGVFGVEACKAPAPKAIGDLCAYGTTQIGPNGTYQLALPAGTWWVAELYLYVEIQGDFGEGIPRAGPSKKVVVTIGTSSVVNLSATYGVN